VLSFLVTHLLFSSDFTITRQCIFILKNFHLQFHSQKQSNHLKSKTSAVEICKALPSTKCWFLLWILTYYNLFQKQLKTPGWASAIYTDTYRWLAVNGFFWWKDLRWLQYVASLWNHKTLHSHAICCVKVNFIWCLTIFFRNVLIFRSRKMATLVITDWKTSVASKNGVCGVVLDLARLLASHNWSWWGGVLLKAKCYECCVS